MRNSHSSVMKKDEYFRLSNVEGLPKRCPILDFCVRRAITMYFYGDYQEPDILHALKGYLPNNFNDKSISCIGESPVWNAPESRKHGYFNGMCSEVNLFDHEHQLGGMEGTASCGGTWDYESEPRKLHLNFKHFSECAEFSKYVFGIGSIQLGQKKYQKSRNRRIGISQKLRFEIFQRDNFTCQYCNRTKDDGVKLQVDHRVPIEQGGTDDLDNLFTACEDCNQGKSNKVIAPIR